MDANNRKELHSQDERKKKAKVSDDPWVMEARKDLQKNVNTTNKIQTKTEARYLKLAKKCLKK